MKLTGNTVLITGGSTGIGLALAKALLAKDNTVMICARTQENLDDAKEQLPELITYCCDIADHKQRKRMFEQIRADGHSINVLVNNAVIMTDYDLASTDEQSMFRIRQEININFVAPIELVNELLPVLKSNTGAAIVNFNSPQGVVPGARTPILSATKAGLHSYSRSLRHHLLAEQIKVVNVFPPGVETPKTANLDFRKISAEKFVSQLLVQLERGIDEIWIGQGRALRILSHISQRFAFTMLNKQLPVIKSTEALTPGA
jgi:uncharacterized oxidoreductase